ncbi:DUF1666 domain-containing protein [Cephalotus follicularis]|uniref:DUF1666 domain-containing protein n=1 Tax=Cephalotus follicularis TaxID=3775 RepID=A0A1Q3AQV7_CEPFO|nr:DUF1666 domain-containing protein [Cephalotus follicularis]
MKGTLNMFFRNTHFDVFHMGSVDGFFYRKMVLFAASFWVYLSTVLGTLFGFINKILLRVKRDGSSQKNNPNRSMILLHENTKYGSNNTEGGTEKGVNTDIVEFTDTKENEKESPKFFLNFQFPSFEEFSRSYGENKNNPGLDLVPSTNTDKNEFKYGEGFSGFMEKPDFFSFTVKELHADSNFGSFCNKEIVDNGFLSETDFMQQNREAETIPEEKSDNSIDGARKEEKPNKLEETTPVEKSQFGDEAAVDEEYKLPNDHDVAEEIQFLAGEEFTSVASESDIFSSHESSGTSPFLGSISDGFLSETGFEETIEPHSLKENNGKKVESNEEDFELEYLNFENSSTGSGADYSGDEDSDIIEELKELEESHGQEELKELEESHGQNSNTVDSDVVSENGIDNKNNSKQEESGAKDNGPATQNSEDSNELETLWEHQDLIEQLKMELKKVRATGLPTILEESESPKIMEDLKPWKIDEKFHHEDTMSELHKFYKSYRDRMRKFDILNYQKMYAIGFLQLKDPLKLIPSGNFSAPAIPTLLSQKVLLSKRKKSESDPMKKFMRELHSDLEIVYVGQMCLSWDILHWQYEKALQLWDSDPYGTRRYNEVAGEFQQFQVLMQRFIENEPFEGPRIQNYAKNRCVLRNLLQVPVIREDGKDKRKARRKEGDENAIRSDMLVEIMEESIRIFWRFVRADKDAHNLIQKSRKGTQVEPQEPTDLELFAEVQASLLKKERKLKDMLRSGKCILRKFQKQQEGSSDQVLYFFTQVDMKLVARVLNMSKITPEQLLWCHNKLSNISFVNRKIHVDHSFSLFPC